MCEARDYVKEEEEEELEDEKDVDIVFSPIKIHEFSVKVRINHYFSGKIVTQLPLLGLREGVKD